MPNNSWENVRRLVKAIAKDGIGMGAAVSVNPFHILTPTLWVNFLNADPESGHSMYPVYKGLMRYVQEFRSWIVKENYEYGPCIREMKLLSRAEFLDIYPEMQKKVDLVHSMMTRLLDKERADLIKVILRGESSDQEIQAEDSLDEEVKNLDFFLLPFTLRIEHVGPGKDNLTLDIPQADQMVFWLYVAFGAMVLAWKDGDVPARRCDNCGEFFIPYPRAREQRFHSLSCKSTYHTRQRREAGM